MNYIYTFIHTAPDKTIRPVEFGPYTHEDEAKAAFQRVYGYWPLDADLVINWRPGGRLP